MGTCQSACFANHDLISFLDIDVILCSSFIALPPKIKVAVLQERQDWEASQIKDLKLIIPEH